MKIRLICAECKRLLKVPEEALNKKVLCPACGAKFIGDPSLVRVKRQPEQAAAAPAAAPARTKPDQQSAPRPAAVAPPPAMPPAAAPSPPPSDRSAPFDFPRLELDPSHASRQAAPVEPDILEGLEDLGAEPAPAEPQVVEEVVQEVAFLEPEVVDSEVVDLTESHPAILEPKVVSELDDVIVPEVVEGETAQAVEPEIAEPVVIEAAEPEVIESATLEPEVVEAAEPEIIESAALEPEVVEALEPEGVEAAALEPVVLEPDAVAEPEVVEAAEEDEPVAKRKSPKKKTGSGLLIGCLLGGLFLVLLAGGGIAAYFYFGNPGAATTSNRQMNLPTSPGAPPSTNPAPNPGPGSTPPQGGPANAWKPFSPAGGNFTVDLPGNPVPGSDPANPNVKFFAVQQAGQKWAFVIFYQDLEAGVKDPTAELERLRQSQKTDFVEAYNGKVVSEKSFQREGADYREIVIEAPMKLGVILRLILSQQGNRYRIYRLIATGPEFRVDSGDAAKFFSSFHIQTGMK